MYTNKEDLRAAVRQVKALTAKPFGVNITLLPALMPADPALYVDVVLDEGVRIVETSGQRPSEDLIARLKAGGVVLMHKCVSVRHALSAQRAGAQVVTLVGTEGGGAVGDLGLTTMTMIPRAVDALGVPVLAAGGIVDGRGLVAALALGASGVMLGTRLLLTRECPIHDNVKEALLAAGETDTVTILTSLRNGYRAWKNAAAQRVADLEARRAGMAEVMQAAAGTLSGRMLEDGDINAGILSCGQSVGIIKEIQPVRDVIQSMVWQAEEIRARLAAG
jgi:nitronate monooxygenase